MPDDIAIRHFIVWLIVFFVVQFNWRLIFIRLDDQQVTA